MAYDVNQIISPDALKQVDQLEKKTGKVVEQILKIHKETAQLDSVLSKIDGKNFQKLEKETKKAVTQNDKLRKSTFDLKKLQTDYTKTLSALAKQKQRATKATSEQRKAEIDLATVNSKSAGTLEKLAAQNRILTRERKKLNLETDKGKKRLKEINAKIDQNNEKIKQNVDGLAQQKIGIGSYTKSIKEALSQMGLMPAQLTRIESGMGAVAKGAGEGSKAMKLLRVAVISTGIGALVVAVVALVTWFKKTVGGGEALIKILAPLKAIFQVLTNRIAKFGEALFKILNGDFSAGFDEMGDAISGVSDELKKQIALQQQLAGLEISLGKQKGDLSIKEAQLRNEIEKNNLAARNESLTIKERLKAQDAAVAATKKLAEERADYLRQEIALMVANEQAGISTQEEINDRKAKIAELIGIEAARDRELRRMVTYRTTLLNLDKKEAKALQTKIDANKKYVETSEELYTDFYDELGQESDDYFDTVIDNSQKEVDATNDKLRKQEDAEAAKRDREIAAEKALAQEIRDAKIQLAQESVNAAFDIYASSLEKQRMQLDQQRNYELNAAGDDAAKKDAINKKYAKKEAELKTKQAKADKLQSMFNIAIQTAVNIVKSYPNPILMALAAAIGGVQEIAVAARPIPKFAKGTKNAPGGLAEVGEAGHELIEQDGRITYVEEPTIMNLQKGAKVYTKKETDRIFQMAGKDDYFVKHAIDRQTSEIVSAINNKTELHISRGGHRIVERKGNYYKEYLSRKIEL